MYTKPNNPDEQLKHWRQVLEETRNDPSMIAYYAFHGAKNDVQTAITYLNNVKNHRTVEQHWLDELEYLSKLRREV